MAGSKLYAWATPAFVSGAPVDHTWVTDYDNRTNAPSSIGAVVAGGAHYWYCWGSFHATGATPSAPDGLLTSKAGSLAMAICLVQPNADSRLVAGARGTIFSYGVDGVCHQLANQVLYACGAAVKVAAARGYAFSSTIYGDYGLQAQAWAAKIAACSPPSKPSSSASSGVHVSSNMRGASGMTDSFEELARAALADDPERLTKLLALRAGMQDGARTMIARREAVDAAALNARNQVVFDEIGRLLTREQYEKLFGVPPGTKVNLVIDETEPAIRSRAR